MTERELEGQLEALTDLSDSVQHQKKKSRQRIRRKRGIHKAGRAYRLTEHSRHPFLNRYARHSSNIEVDFYMGKHPAVDAVNESDRSGIHIVCSGRNHRKKHLKKYANRKVRRRRCFDGQGNAYRRMFDYWWLLD